VKFLRNLALISALVLILYTVARYAWEYAGYELGLDTTCARVLLIATLLFGIVAASACASK
jgi:hypothetical protein